MRILVERQVVRRSRRAFTLMELLIALLLTAIVAGILASSLYTAFRAKASIENALDIARQSDSAGDMIASELQLALPPAPNNQVAAIAGLGFLDLNTATGIMVGPFQGDAASLTFYASGPEPKNPDNMQHDVRQISYALVTDPDARPDNPSQLLVRRVRMNILADSSIPDPPDEIIARNVTKFTLSYFDGVNWMTIWDSSTNSELPTMGATPTANSLPQAVQFTLERSPSPGTVLTDTRTVPIPCAPPASSASATDPTMGGALP